MNFNVPLHQSAEMFHSGLTTHTFSTGLKVAIRRNIPRKIGASSGIVEN